MFEFQKQDKSSNIKEEPPFGDRIYSDTLPQKMKRDTNPTGNSYNLDKVWSGSPDVPFGKKFGDA